MDNLLHLKREAVVGAAFNREYRNRHVKKDLLEWIQDVMDFYENKVYISDKEVDILRRIGNGEELTEEEIEPVKEFVIGKTRLTNGGLLILYCKDDWEREKAEHKELRQQEKNQGH